MMMMGLGVVDVGDVSERGMMVDGPTTANAEDRSELGSTAIGEVGTAVSRVGFPGSRMWLLGKGVKV